MSVLWVPLMDAGWILRRSLRSTLVVTHALYSLLCAALGLCSHRGRAVLPHTAPAPQRGAGERMAAGAAVCLAGPGCLRVGFSSSGDCSALNVFAARTSLRT